MLVGVERKWRKTSWKILKAGAARTVRAFAKADVCSLDLEWGFKDNQRNSYPFSTQFLRWFLKFLFYFCFLGPHLRHMEVPRLGVQSELQLLAYATATAMQGPSCVFHLHYSSRQCQILNPLSKAGD